MRHEAGEAASIEEIEEKIKGVIAGYSMLPQGCAVVAGLSGGADSTALTHFLFTHQKEYGVSLTAVHVNHGIRAAAGEDEEAARRFCQGLGAPFRALRADVPALARQKGLSLEDCGRRVRYGFFRQVLAELGGPGRIATAHTSTDSAETMLLNLTRGAGARGLRGIPPVRGEVVRPLISLTRQEVEAYCRWYRLPFVQDETNFTEEYARNKIRLRVTPALRELNPALERAMARSAQLLAQDDALLYRMARQALEEARRGAGWSLPALRRLERPVLSRAMILAAEEAGCARLTRENVEEMVQAALHGGGAAVAGGIQITARGNTLFAERPVPQGEGWCVPLSLPETLLPDGRRLKIRPAGPLETENPKKFYKFLFHNPANYDTIHDMVARTRRPGDIFRPAGRGVSKTLKKLFSEEGLSPAQRAGCVLLASRGGGEIFWAEGFGPCEAWNPRGHAQGLFCVEIEEKGV